MLGHERIIKNLSRLADTGRLAHAYLFFGPAGVGKRHVAEGLARYLERGEFAAETEKVLNDCLRLGPGEEGSIGIDAVRETLKDFLWRKPNVSPRRTAIIRRCETITGEAQNALLKILEEPPASGLLILLTHDPEALLGTLRSRLHEVYFAPFPERAIKEWLRKEHNAKEADAARAAAVAFGSPGRALALLASGADEASMAEVKEFIAKPARREELVKRALAREDFDLRAWLDRCILCIAPDATARRAFPLWHKLLELRDEAARGTLNPRIQLQALMRYL